MAAPFFRTLRSLSGDSAGRWTWLLVPAGALLAAWVAWFFLARVAVYAVSERARLEVDSEVHPLQTPVAGRIAATHLVLGSEVRAGEALLELDSRPQQLAMAEQQKAAASLKAQIEVLDREIAAQERIRTAEAESGVAAVAEAQAQTRQAQDEARLAGDELHRLQPLRAQGMISEAELARAQGAVKARQAALDARKSHAEQLALDKKLQGSQADARIEAQRREQARLRGQLDIAAATLETLANEIERRIVRAPVGGRVGKVMELPLGSYVHEGDMLGSIVPAGGLRVVAEFLPQIAAGRVRPGQYARLRLEGFAWTQYGSLPARVSSVASEAQDGRVRVELAVQASVRTQIPLQHGLPGTVEVETEQISPAVLVLRAAGAMLSKGRTPAPREVAGQ